MGSATRAETIVRRVIRPALWVLVLAPALFLGYQAYLFVTDPAYSGYLGANPPEKLEVQTGLWTLRFLAASLAISPLMRLTGWGWMVAQRRFLGLAAFFWVVGHLSVYVVLDWFFDWESMIEDVLKHLYITIGMLGFLCLLPLAITSTKGWIRRLGGRRWNRLHRLVYVAAVAGCVHFMWAVKKDLYEPILYSVVFAVLFAARLSPRGRAATARPVRT